MIAVDTNVVLRRLLQDDAAQSVKVNQLFARANGFLITDVVLAEVVWTLAGKRYGASRDDIVAAITSLFEEPAIHFEHRAAVWAALNDYVTAASIKTSNGRRSADFADALIVRKAIATISARGEPYEGTYTFDQPAQYLAGTKSL